MYPGSAGTAGGVLATGLIAASSGWSVVGGCLVAVAVLIVGTMTVTRLTRKRRGG